MLAATVTEDYPTPEPIWRDTARATSPADDERTLAPGVTVTWRNRANLDRPPLSLFTGEDWHSGGRCFTAGLELFFGDEADDNPRLKPTVLARAQALCRGCPVATTCLTVALATDERYGVWGGASGRQRDKMRTRIDAGEPQAEVVTGWLDQL